MNFLLPLLALWRNRNTDEGSSAWRKFIRKWFGYALIAVLIAMSSLALTNYIKTQKQDVAIAKQQEAISKYQDAFQQQVEINAQQDKALQQIGSIRELDGSVLTSLQTDLGRLRERDSALNTKLIALEKSNAQVRALMSTSTSGVPGGGCVLDQSCKSADDGDKGGGTHPAAKPAPEVPKAKANPGAGSAGLRYQFQRPPICLR